MFTDFFEWLIYGIYGFVNNYGLAIVVFTILIRVALLPLEIKSKKSMRAMNKVQPKMQELQKKYAKDKEKLNQKMQELYKKEKINPLSGCLPMLLQLPLLFVMFGAMRNLASAQTGQMLVDLFNRLVESGVDGVGALTNLQGFLWIKNVFQPDSFANGVLPSFANAINAIKTAGIEFTAPEGLEAIYNSYLATHYGASQFMNVSVLFWTIRIPTTLTALFQYANGLFILPLFAAASQMLMTKLTAPQTQQPADPNSPANMMNSGAMKWMFPLMSLYFCASYNAAFALYWATGN
ncbi:MAG: YidC/Oxa1 family membrane protein insertase, partial [Christensenellales bacterium]